MDRLDGRRAYRQRLGARGEDRAADWYRAAGYDVIARNWRCPEGELDLVVSLAGELVFCEVKTRTSGTGGGSIRFDVVAVLGSTVDVIEAAF